ncbi:hypothetical protein LA080_008139 [Diaporthe eres]|uniref:Uncharacterized protein n=1 Tax=Diaporthe vaccinii TaxID=105482 RepID=A0ABR4EPG1_9PEZI|nr:hypothetical protein LA080_008139 [Diaporthe eres]
MATLKATDPTLGSDDPTTGAPNSEDPKPEDPKPEDSKSENPQTEEIKPEDPKSKNLQAEEVKPEEEEGQGLHATPRPSIPQPIAVTSDQWRKYLATLIRFPVMVRDMTLFRPSSPIAEIAFALGATDSTYTIIDTSWFMIAERVLDVQTCCLEHAKHINFDIAADGWITEDITAEWYDRVLQDLRGRGFRTACTAMVAFVARVYLQTSSWVRFDQDRGMERHGVMIDALKPDPSAAVIKRCSLLAKGFTSAVEQSRLNAIKRAEEQNSHREPRPHSEKGV